MEQTKLVPKRRFKEFQNAHAWEQRKLGDHANYRRGSFPQPYGKKEWYDGDGAMPFVQVVDVTDHLVLVNETKQKISKLAQSKSVFVPKGKIVVTLQGSIGRVAITQYDAFVDRTLLIFEGYEKPTDEHFWAYTIQQKFEVEKQKAPGGTIKTITKEALSSFEIYLPEYEEQKKIGSFFAQLDHLITLHQRKLEKIKALKSAYLSEMFPAEGEREPKRRFAGFTQAWEEHSLSNVGDFVRTIVDPQATPDDSFVEYSMPSYDNGRNPEIVFGDSMQSMRLKISGDVLLINKLNIRQKRIWLVKDAPSNAVASSEFMPFTSTEIDLAFLEQLMLSDKATRDLESISSGTSNSQKRITPSDVLKYLIKLPVDRAEQEKIGSFFKNIDNLITLHQRKLEKLQNLKKAYLNEMFV